MSAMTPTVVKKTLPNQIKAVLQGITGPADRSLLPFLPRPVKLLIALIFILNRWSLPFVWHIRVLSPIWDLSIEEYRNSRRRRKWLDGRMRVGANPFELVSTAKRYAGFDDCDWNMHLSNSSYTKIVDTTRLKASSELFGPISGDGVWIALAGSQYHFIREIPMGTHYEVQTTWGSWDDRKWFYMVHTFVSYPKSKSAKGAINPAISTPSTPPEFDEPRELKAPYQAPPNIPTSLLRKSLPQGAVVHCIGVSLYCFKIGRITVPPPILFIAVGFGDVSKRRFPRIQDLRFHKSGKNRLTDMLKGGWRTDDNVDGWAKSEQGDWSSFWELPEFEEQRKQRMDDIFGAFYGSMHTLKMVQG